MPSLTARGTAAFLATRASLHAAASRVWTDDRLFCTALTAFNIFLARRTFQSGVWADNDSVCHYAYVRHLLEDVLPATGTFFGWTPKYDLGAPFLLYNTPPGLYVGAAAIAKLTGLSALWSLKLLMVAAYLALPLVGSRLAATFEDGANARGDLPKFAALTLSLFSSELFGLEFFFKNGMLNPALALPFAVATLTLFRQAQHAKGPRVLSWLALAAVSFATTAFVHLLTTYMLGVTLLCFAIAAGPRSIGRGVFQVGAVVALGAGLASFWLVPSFTFAAKEDAAFTWIRRPLDTVSSFLDGSLLSSYQAAFYPRFVEYSGVGIIATLCAGAGVWRAVERRNWAVLACAISALVALLLSMGPSPSFGLWILPMYGHLLWYRFATLLELSTLLVAAWGAWQLWGLRARVGPIVVYGLLGGAIWAGLVMTKRAVHIETADKDFPQFVQDVDDVSRWLREHGKHRGRVFSEFLGQNVVDSASVNYPRHMIPVLSGYSEAGGWVYENDEAAQAELRRGLFWYDPFPMIALAERYDVEYIAAGSPNFVRALTEDPRWRLVLFTDHLSLFEAVGREPSLTYAQGWNSQVVSENYLRGGGYEYVVQAAPATSWEGARATTSLLVKTSWSPAWRARSSAAELEVEKTKDGLIELALPQGATTVTLTWDITELRSKGNRISLVALVIASLLALLGTRKRLPGWEFAEGRTIEGLGIGGACLAMVVLGVRARPLDLHKIGFGVNGGVEPTYDLRSVAVGSFDDAEAFRLTRVEPSAWGPRVLSGALPARVLADPRLDAATVSLAPRGKNLITVRGFAQDGLRRHVTMALRPPGAMANDPPSCRVEAEIGEPSLLPDACTSGQSGDGPGVVRTLQLGAGSPLTVTGIDVDSGILVVEAEQMHNALDDSGYDAFYAYGPPKLYASNGISMVANASYDYPIALDRDVSLPEGQFEVWLLTRTVSPRLENGRAHFLVESDGKAVADIDAKTRKALPFWDDDLHAEWLPAGRVLGGATRTIRVTFYKTKIAFNGVGDLDAMAFVPVVR